MGVFLFESSALSESLLGRVERADSMYLMYWVYMIKNKYSDLYTGITDNPQQRLKHHSEKRGALYTKRDSKFEIVFLEQYPTLIEARKREIQIKKWRREKKELLIDLYKKDLSTKL